MAPTRPLEHEIKKASTRESKAKVSKAAAQKPEPKLMGKPESSYSHWELACLSYLFGVPFMGKTKAEMCKGLQSCVELLEDEITPEERRWRISLVAEEAREVCFLAPVLGLRQMAEWEVEAARHFAARSAPHATNQDAEGDAGVESSTVSSERLEAANGEATSENGVTIE